MEKLLEISQCIYLERLYKDTYIKKPKEVTNAQIIKKLKGNMGFIRQFELIMFGLKSSGGKFVFN